MTVTEIIKEKYGLDAIPGKKTKCVFCGHQTMQINPANTIAKCFRCGDYIHVKKQSSRESSNFFCDYLTEFSKHVHKSLVATQNTAYEYLVSRGIHPKVIANALVGVVHLPDDFDKVIEKIDLSIDCIYSKKINDVVSSSLRSKTKDRETDLLREEQAQQKEKLTSFSKLMKMCIDWLAFFHTDSDLNITKILLRFPFSKDFRSIKFGSEGVFGLSMFNNTDSNLIVHEGGFNALQHQSLILRTAEDAELDLDDVEYGNIVSVGSAATVDFDTIKTLEKDVVIFPDCDEAGQSVISNAQRYFYFREASIPGGYSDLDEFATKNNTLPNSEVLEMVNAMVATAHQRYINFDYLAKHISDLRDSEDKPHLINSRVAAVVLNDLSHRAKFLVSEEVAYLFNRQEHLLFELEDNNNFRLLMAKFGVNPAEQIYKYLLAELQTNAFVNGCTCNINKLSHYDASKNALLVYDGSISTYCITADKIERVLMGDDNIYFKDIEMQAFSIDDNENSESATDFLGPEPEKNDVIDRFLLQSINFEKDELSDGERRFLIRSYTHSILFSDLMPTKPIITFYGQKGSGKTNILRRIGLMLFGEDFEVMSLPEKEDAFNAVVANTKLAVFDNVDGFSEWLNDRICNIATGSKIPFRKLYSNNKLLKFRANCFLGLTTRTPHFRRDDVADRLLIFRLLPSKLRRTEREMTDEILENRPKLWAQLFEDSRAILKNLPHIRDYRSTTRMADFERFSYACMLAFGYKYDVHPDNFYSLFKRLTTEQEIFSVEFDATYELLFEWITENPGKQVTNSELHDELRKFANDKSKQYKCQSLQSFIQKMVIYRKKLSEFFDIKEEDIAYRKKAWRFSPKNPSVEYELTYSSEDATTSGEKY